MSSLEGLFLRRSVNRAKQMHAAGDADGARDVLQAFVKRFPKSQRGWIFLLWAVGEANGSIEDRLEVLRQGAAAVPYDTMLMDAAVGHLMRAAMMIGERRYLDEASTVIDRFEEVLGPSVDSVLERAALAQLSGDEKVMLELFDRAEAMIRDHPNERAQLKLGLGLSSVAGHEERGKQIAESSANKLKDPAAFAYLAAIVEHEDPARAEYFLSEARRVGARGSPPAGYLERVIAEAREDIRLEKEFLKNVGRKG